MGPTLKEKLEAIDSRTSLRLAVFWNSWRQNSEVA